MRKATSGFTIVELLIVIVVIAILAAISVVAYNGIQTRARDNVRKADLSSIAKALELYRADFGEYPPSPANIGWCTQISHPSHPQVRNALQAIMSKIPKDPLYADTYQDYFYRKNSEQSYTLAAELEGSDLADDAINNGCIRIGNIANEYDYVLTN